MPSSDVAAASNTDAAEAAAEREAPRRLDVVAFARNHGPDEYRRLSANWKDRSKADAFVALAVAQYESDNRSLSPIDFENGVPASADRFLAW